MEFLIKKINNKDKYLKSRKIKTRETQVKSIWDDYYKPLQEHIKNGLTIKVRYEEDIILSKSLDDASSFMFHFSNIMLTRSCHIKQFKEDFRENHQMLLRRASKNPLGLPVKLNLLKK